MNVIVCPYQSNACIDKVVACKLLLEAKISLLQVALDYMCDSLVYVHSPITENYALMALVAFSNE